MKSDEIYKKIMHEFRCSYCNKLLFKGKIFGNYNIETLCSRCKNKTVFSRKFIKVDSKDITIDK